ncbi:hypothetical protein BRC80_04340 [Halobacteriales archaeon QH_9_66_26]|nr:MAG: hypothetical protein BRC80_04340 [Halobacteriales archaeon QH_9_66_26]
MSRNPRRTVRRTIPASLLSVSWWLLPLHGGAATSPVPGWVVLLVAVPCLWLAIGGGVVALERVLAGVFDSS